jgi:predicted enzyme related to lactoylglutathione lyase
MTNSKLQLAALCLVAFALGMILDRVITGRQAQSAQGSYTEEYITGIGGIFFKAEDPEATREWYRQHLGIAGEGPGVNFFWRERGNSDLLGFTVWSIFPADTEYFGADEQEFMVNYRVRDLDALLARLEEEGIQHAGEIEEYSYGRFAWILDGDGRRVELWEPVYSR